MKIVLISLIGLFSFRSFGACKDFTGHYGWNTGGNIPMTLEVTQTGCEHIEFVLNAPTVNFVDTRSIELNGVFATLKDDDSEKVDGLWKFDGDALAYVENHQPKNNTLPFVDQGKYTFIDDNTLANNFDRVQNGVRSTFSFIYSRQ